MARRCARDIRLTLRESHTLRDLEPNLDVLPLHYHVSIP